MREPVRVSVCRSPKGEATFPTLSTMSETPFPAFLTFSTRAMQRCASLRSDLTSPGSERTTTAQPLELGMSPTSHLHGRCVADAACLVADCHRKPLQARHRGPGRIYRHAARVRPQGVGHHGVQGVSEWRGASASVEKRCSSPVAAGTHTQLKRWPRAGVRSIGRCYPGQPLDNTPLAPMPPRGYSTGYTTTPAERPDTLPDASPGALRGRTRPARTPPNATVGIAISGSPCPARSQKSTRPNYFLVSPKTWLGAA